MVNKNTEEIICVAEDCGKTHDFKLYKKTIGGRVLESIKAQLDSGYQGIIEIVPSQQKWTQNSLKKRNES